MTSLALSTVPLLCRFIVFRGRREITLKLARPPAASYRVWTHPCVSSVPQLPLYRSTLHFAGNPSGAKSKCFTLDQGSLFNINVPPGKQTRDCSLEMSYLISHHFLLRNVIRGGNQQGFGDMMHNTVIICLVFKI